MTEASIERIETKTHMWSVCQINVYFTDNHIYWLCLCVSLSVVWCMSATSSQNLYFFWNFFSRTPRSDPVSIPSRCQQPISYFHSVCRLHFISIFHISTIDMCERWACVRLLCILMPYFASTILYFYSLHNEVVLYVIMFILYSVMYRRDLSDP